MPTMLDALSTGKYDLVDKRDKSSQFSRLLTKYRDIVVDNYFKKNIPLNNSIADLKKQHGLNDDQVQRIVEETNNQVYLIKYNQIKDHTNRNVEFDLASLKGVNGETENKQRPQEKTIESKSNLSKTASVNNRDSVHSRVNFNHSSYSKINMISEEVMDLEKMAQEWKCENEMYEKTFNEYCKIASDLGSKISEYELKGFDGQDIFNKICKIANVDFNSYIQRDIIKSAEYYRDNIGKRINPEFEFNLEPIKIASVNDEKYSLGKFSKIQKTANDDNQLSGLESKMKALKSLRDQIDQHIKKISELKNKSGEKNLESLTKKAYFQRCGYQNNK